MSKFEGAHIAITGASNGLGAALAIECARRGAARLSLAARNEDRLRAVSDRAEALGAVSVFASVDMKDGAAIEQWADHADSAQPVDYVFANAGVFHGAQAPARLESPAQAAEQIQVNLAAPARLLTFFAQRMIERQRGRLVAIGSIAGIQPIADAAAYSASKTGLCGLTESLRDYGHDFGVGVTLIQPGFVETGMKEGFRGARPFEWSAEKAARRICDAVERGADEYAFPWHLALSAKMGRFIPWRLRRHITKTLRFRFD